MKHIVLSTLLCACVSGCSSTGLLKAPGASVLAKPISVLTGRHKSERVGKILCLWEAAEGQGMDDKPSRGFAGQVMFFGNGEATPIEVHGTVRIYQYVDYDPTDPDPQPVHEVTFEDGAWNAHSVEGTLGKSYNIFLPALNDDARHTVCTLRVEHESESGRKTSSTFTDVTLAAKTSKAHPSGIRRNVLKQGQSGIRQASAVRDAEASRKEVERKLNSTTIQMPSRSR